MARNYNTKNSATVEDTFNQEIKYRGTTKKHRLNRCEAWYYETETNLDFLVSYSTVVAVLDKSRKEIRTLYTYYSNTTTQHIYKYARKMGAIRILFCDDENKIVRTVELKP